MKNKLFAILLMIALFCTALCGCGETQESDNMPDFGINWQEIFSRISSGEPEQYGLYTDVSELEIHAETFGTVAFSNYDSTEFGSFLEEDYQYCIEYGVGGEYDPEADDFIYYDFPVYYIFMVDNNSDSYYSCIYTEDFNLVCEDGDWFIDEDKDEFISTLLENCRTLIFGD